MSWIWKLWKGDGDPSQQQDSHRNNEPTPSTRFDTHPPIVQYVDSSRKRAGERKPKRRHTRAPTHTEDRKTKPTINETSIIDQNISSIDQSTDMDENHNALVLRKRTRSETCDAEAESNKGATIDLTGTISPSYDVVNDTRANRQSGTRLARTILQPQSQVEHPENSDPGAAGRIDAPYRPDTQEAIGNHPAEAEPAGTIGEAFINTADDVSEVSGDTGSTKKLRWPYVSKTWRHEYRNSVSVQQQFNGTTSLCPSGQLLGIGMWPGSSHIPGQPKVLGNKSAVLALPATKISIVQENTAVPIAASATQWRLNNDATILLPPLFKQEKPQRRKLCTACEKSLKPKQKTTGPPQRALEGIWSQSVGSPRGPTEWTG